MTGKSWIIKDQGQESHVSHLQEVLHVQAKNSK